MDPRKRGADTEYRFFEALSERTSYTPFNFVGVTRASPRMDVDGFDGFIKWRTKVRPEGMTIPFQIKSSYGGLLAYIDKYPTHKEKGVPVLIIRRGMTPENIRRYTYLSMHQFDHVPGDYFTSFIKEN